MHIDWFILKRMIRSEKGNQQFSKPVIRIAMASIALGLGIMILAGSIVSGFKKEITEKLSGITAHIQVTKLTSSSSLETEPISLSDTVMQKIKNIDGVLHIQPFSIKHGILKTKKEIQGVVVKGVDNNYDWTFLQQHIKSGNILQAEKKDSIPDKRILISKIIADQLEIKAKDSIYIYYLSQYKKPRYSSSDALLSNYSMIYNDSIIESKPSAMKVKVEGIYESGMVEMDQQLILADMELVQLMYKWNDKQISGYEINISDYQLLDSLTWMVDDQLPASHYVSNIRENYPEIFEWLPTIDINSTIITVLMITVSIMAMISTLLILILEKTTFIGILKAMGMNNFQLRKIFIYHSIFIILQGMMYGNLIGIGLCWIQKKWGLIKLDIESYYLSEVPIHLDLIHIISLNVLTFLICIIALLVPSYLVSRISPVKAIRMD